MFNTDDEKHSLFTNFAYFKVLNIHILRGYYLCL